MYKTTFQVLNELKLTRGCTSHTATQRSAHSSCSVYCLFDTNTVTPQNMAASPPDSKRKYPFSDDKV
jgi:hypothetical protein